MGHLADQVAKDEFTDLSLALDKYRTYRDGILRKFGNPAASTSAPAPATTAPAPASTAPAPTATTTPAPAASAPAPAASAPAPAPAPAPSATAPAATASAPPKQSAFAFGADSGAKPLVFGAPAGDGAFKLPAFGAAPTATGGALPAFKLPAFGGADAAPKATSFDGVFKLPAFGGAAALPAFSFGKPAADAAGAAGAAGAADGGEDGGEDGEDDNAPIPAEEPTKPDQFKKGAGEEDEDTLFELEGVKLFEKQADGKWEKLGVGLVRINENRTTKKRRLLSRSEGVGQVLLNTNLFAGMRATVLQGAKLTSVDLLCALPGKNLVHILARVATEADATKLVQAIEKYRPA